MAYLIIKTLVTAFQPKIKYRKRRRPIRDNKKVLSYRVSIAAGGSCLVVAVKLGCSPLVEEWMQKRGLCNETLTLRNHALLSPFRSRRKYLNFNQLEGLKR